VQKKGRASRKTETRGLGVVDLDFCYVMLTLTVMAGLVTPPEDGVIVTVDVLGFGPPPPLQPATTINTIIAPSIPMRARNRRVEGIMNRSEMISITRNTCRRVVAGGSFMDCGATTKEEAVSVAVAVAPGAAAAFVVGTAHAVTSVLPGVQVKATAPVNPPSPVIVTGKVPMAPLATLTLDGAETEKSQPVPVRGTVCGLPLASSVNVSDPATGPAAVGVNVTLTVQLALAARVVAQVVVLPKPLDVLGTAVKFNVALPLLVRVTVCAALVVVSN